MTDGNPSANAPDGECLHPGGFCVSRARQLRLIANDLRINGDIELRLLSEHGVSDAPITLADELWLIAMHLDPDHAFEDAQGPDGDPNG